jgi:hypothetical protein
VIATNDKPKPDVNVDRHGTVASITPLTQRAREWVEENVKTEGWQWQGPTFTVESAYVDEIVAGMTQAGLRVV